MRFYLVTAVLVFSFIAYVFWQDDDASKDDIKSWLFIAFAASIWPITLPNMIRKVVTKSMKSEKKAHAAHQMSSRPFVYESFQEHLPR